MSVKNTAIFNRKDVMWWNVMCEIFPPLDEYFLVWLTFYFARFFFRSFCLMWIYFCFITTPSLQWRSRTKMVTEANQFILLMIGAIRMEWVQCKNGICTNFTEASVSVRLTLATALLFHFSNGWPLKQTQSSAMFPYGSILKYKLLLERSFSLCYACWQHFTEM